MPCRNRSLVADIAELRLGEVLASVDDLVVLGVDWVTRVSGSQRRAVHAARVAGLVALCVNPRGAQRIGYRLVELVAERVDRAVCGDTPVGFQ
jgi:hypothetical protein